MDHGKPMARYSVMNIPKVSKEVGVIIKFQRIHKSPPHPAPFCQNTTLNQN